jgi:bacteriocin-like protein
MEKVMTTQSSNTQTQLSDNELNAVIGGHQKFHYETMNGHTYAIGHINGRTVMVKVD